MKKQMLADGIVHVTFDPKPEAHYATSVTVIFDGNKVLLIDAAYACQMAMLLDMFAKDNMTVDRVVMTHFHSDHMEGLKCLPKTPVYGGCRFQETLDLWINPAEHVHFTPTILVDAPLKLLHGAHHLTIKPLPGHSACGLLVEIDDRFVHIGDEVMFAADGEPLLPVTNRRDVKRHLDSLDKLGCYVGWTIIPSHGDVFDGKALAGEIKNRRRYLKAIHNSIKPISYADAVKGCDCTFAHREWHRYNIC